MRTSVPLLWSCCTTVALKEINELMILIYIMLTEEQSAKTGSIVCGCHGLYYIGRVRVKQTKKS